MLDAALASAVSGWPVFPIHSAAAGSCSCGNTACTSPGKHPRTEHGFKDASSDVGVIRDWWQRWPTANIGLPTGQPSGIWVLDVDPRHGGGDSLDELETKYSPLPGSVEVLTGGGGRHIYFRWTPEGPRNSEGKLGPGLDVRGEGGYVLLPPSSHLSGRVYEWEASSHPDDLVAANPPDWLLKLLSGPGSRRRQAGPLPERLTDGVRNSSLLSLAGSMRSRGSSQDAIDAALLAENKTKGQPPLEETEVMDIAHRYEGQEQSHGSSDPEVEKDNKNQATQIVDLCLEAEMRFWHDPDYVAYVSIPVDRHQENWAVRGTLLIMWAKRQFFYTNGKVPAAQALQDALGILEAIAQFDGDEFQVATRTAAHGGNYYLDLANSEWKVVEITPDGWNVISDPPVKFRRPKGMLPLPTPDKNGDANLLRPFINLRGGDDNAWKLVVAYLIMAFRPSGPHPVLVVNGEQGSAKTTLVRIIRSLVDPNLADCRSQPRDVRDLMIAARNGWIIALDNLSSIPAWLSDALCRLSTGGAFGTRELYTDDDEILFAAQCPVIINGISELATRGDLLDRSIITILAAIPKDKRRAEKQFWAEFKQVKPKILGGLLNVVSSAMAKVESVHLEALPRMADFAEFATAAEGEMGWPSASFMEAYDDNRDNANEAALEASPVTDAIQSLLGSNPAVEETATELLVKLGGEVSNKTSELKAWPKSAQSLSAALRRLAPNLRAIGIEVDFKRVSGRRTISIQKLDADDRHPRHAVTENVSQAQELRVSNDGAGDDDCHDSVISEDNTVTPSVPEPVAHDANDGDDEELHILSSEPIDREAARDRLTTNL